MRWPVWMVLWLYVPLRLLACATHRKRTFGCLRNPTISLLYCPAMGWLVKHLSHRTCKME